MPIRPSLTTFRAILFDVDGTLVDSLEMLTRGLGDTYEKYLGTRPERDVIRSLIGTPLSKQMLLFGQEAPSAERLDEMTRYAMTQFKAHEEYESPFISAIETLRLCHGQGLATALVTSKNAEELKGFLNRFSGTPYVNTTVCASDVHHPKPDPESALLACRRLGVAPHEAIFVGDSVYDIRCGRSAGTSTAAVTYGAAPREVLELEQPDVLFETPESLLEWAQSAFLEPTCPARVNPTPSQHPQPSQ